MRCDNCDCDLTAAEAWARWDNPPGPDPPTEPRLVTPADVMAHPEWGLLPPEEAVAVCQRCAVPGRAIPWKEMVALRSRRLATGMTLAEVDRELERLAAQWADRLRQAKARRAPRAKRSLRPARVGG